MLTEIAASFWFSTVRWTRVKENGCGQVYPCIPKFVGNCSCKIYD